MDIIFSLKKKIKVQKMCLCLTATTELPIVGSWTKKTQFTDSHIWTTVAM